MTSALGQGLVLLGLLSCAVGAPVGFVAGARRSLTGLRWTQRLAYAFATAMVLATLVMVVALVRHDFSVHYVAQVGSLATPLHITIVSLWSSLEGSILFWGGVLGLFVAALARLQREGHEDYLAYALAVCFIVGGYFCFLIAGPANPFAAVPPPIPTDGPGPNPLLQNHLLMIIHPPTLYLGYVGMTIPFAMACAALLRGQLGPTWLRPLRNWLLIPTSFLTLGLMLGGWWSYEVLGWGGYWAWDPVENAAFLPWLTAVAALHSAVVQQRRGTLKAWTTILVMISFLLTILGTFLTRSGVINSVHSFTQGPIGPFFLWFLGALTLGVIGLLTLRIDTLVSHPSGSRMASREGAFLLNNLFLVAITFTVLIGTLYPIVAEALRGVKVSVGEPYFNRMAVPLFLALILLMGVGPALPWGSGDPKALRRAVLMPLPAALVGLVVAWALGGRGWSFLTAGTFAGYALWVTLDQLSRPARARRRKGEGTLEAARRASILAPRRLGAYTVHFGVLIVFVAIAVSSTFQVEAEANLSAQGTMTVDDYVLTFEGSAVDTQPHVTRNIATIGVAKSGRRVATLEPSLNFYPRDRQPLGSPAVRTGAIEDLYLTLMSIGEDGRIGLRAIVTPGVVWVWIGPILMCLGTLLCLLPTPAPRPVEVVVPMGKGGLVEGEVGG
jgi:cytochrome c-type biogenesis protein CcmF